MAQYNAIKAAVNAYIKANGRKEITGQILNSVLNASIDSLGKYFQFAGEARQDTDPGTPDQNVTYLAGVPGTYTNFGGLVVDQEEIALLMWDGEWHKHTMLIGIREVFASVDNQVGTPSVDVNYEDAELTLAFHNLKGEQGNAAGFGAVTADVDENVGTPGVSVETSGADTAKNFTFHFTNLKGQKGDTGVTSVNVAVDNNTGVPSATASLSGGVLTLSFHNLKGQQGNTGSSVDYPYTLVNNVETDDATQGLSAAMGVYLREMIEHYGGIDAVTYTIEQGAIASATGNDSSSTTRLRTNGYVTGHRLRFIPGSGKVMVFSYNDDGYIKNTDWQTNTIEVDFVGATKYRAVFAKSNDSSINTSDFNTLGMGITEFVGSHADHISKEADVDSVPMFNVRYGANYCNPAEITIQATAYIKSSTGEYKASGSSGSAGVTGYIPVVGKALYCNQAFGSSAASWAAYRRATTAELTDSGVLKFIVGNDILVFSHGGGQTTAKYYQYADGDLYVRFTLASTSNVMVNEGAMPLPYTAYTKDFKFNPSLIGKDITLDNIKDTEYEFGSRNLCNPSECILTDHYYIDATNGVIKSSSGVDSAGVTGMIPIDEAGLYFSQSRVSGTNVGYAYFDERGNYLNGYSVPNPITGGSPTFAKYITGAKWVVFTINSGVTDVMVSRGSTAVSYEAYAGKREVISRDILPKTDTEVTNTMLDGVDVVLPSEIVVTQSDRLQLFYRDIITAFDPYQFAVECICSVGNPFPRCFEYKPKAADAGKTFSLAFRIYDNDHRLVASASTSIKVVANATTPGSQRNILLVGASTLYDGTIAKEVNRRFTALSGDGTYYNPTGLGLSNIALVGRTATSDPLVKQESQSGWQWKDYATSGRSAYRFFVTNIGSYDLREGAVYSGAGTLKFTITEINNADGYFSCTFEGSGTQPASGTLTKYSGDGSDSVAYDSYNIDSRNPFWDDDNNVLDFTSYITDYCGGQLDILVSYLGINDIFQSRPVADTIDDYVIPFLRALHTQSPSTKVILCNLHIPSPEGGMGKTYGATSKTYWTMAAKYFDYIRGLNELIADAEFSSWVSIASTFEEFDAENLYPVNNTRTICNRSLDTEEIQSDGVHPTSNGKKAIADSIFHKITQKL